MEKARGTKVVRCEPFTRLGCMALLFVCLFVSAGYAASDFTQARAALAQYRTETAAVDDALSKQDAPAVQQHQTAASDALKRARALYEEAGAAKTHDMQVLREYGEILATVGDYDLAAETWHKIVDATPADASAWKELGRSLSELGHTRAQEALQALRRSLDLAPEADTYFLLGRLYRREGLCDLASEALGKALEREPAHMGARIAMAALKIQDGHVREANADLDAIGLPPPRYAAEFDQAIKEAVDYLLDARRILPDTPEDALAYAKIMLRAGHLPEALYAAERAARLASNDETIQNFIGDVAVTLNMRDRAREAYNRSLELKPEQPRTKERLQALDQPAK